MVKRRIGGKEFFLKDEQNQNFTPENGHPDLWSFLKYLEILLLE